MREYACTRRELSCIIGNLFAELDPPCAACDSDADELTISGRTYTGAQAVLTVTEWGFRFDGDRRRLKKSGERGACGVADEKEFIIITKAKDLAFHTYDMTTARRFPKRHGKLAVDLMEFAREIVIHIQDANELDVQDAGEFRERRYEQKQALSRCKDMLFLIELAERKNLISTAQCAAWTKYAVEVKRMTASWRKKDLERFTESRQRGNAPRR